MLVLRSIQWDNLIDIGTGAGFPGIPLKIYLPQTNLTLLDSSYKKTRFLNWVKNKLQLSSVEVVWGRAENYGRNERYRERYSLAIARAVAPLNVLVELALPFVKIGGFFLAQKGRVEQELKEAKGPVELLGGQLERIEEYSLPGVNVQRSLILIRKVLSTPPEFPRRPGLPRRKPIMAPARL
jgi:16S rRNA (guanine527-N7)-methyltransferase